jgi:hypothetical protein
MGSAFKEQLRQFLWLNPMAHFHLRGWIGVHKEGIPPGPEFLLRLLLCLKETDFTPVPLLVVCPDLPTFMSIASIASGYRISIRVNKHNHARALRPACHVVLGSSVASA